MGVVSAGVEIATQVIEAVGSIAAGIQGLKVLGISRDYYELYKKQKDFYYTVFQSGAETPLVSEALGIAKYSTDYAGRVAGLYNGVTGPFGGASTDTQGWWARHSAMYGAAPDDRIKELDLDMARVKSDWSNYLFRFEEAWADLRNDSRWQKRLMAHNIGTKQGTNVASSLNGALEQYQQNSQDLSNMLATYGNGVAMYAGYRKGLSDHTNGFMSATQYDYTSPPRSYGDDARLTLPTVDPRTRAMG